MTIANQSTPPFSERFEHLPLTAVMPSPTNPRTHFDEAYIAELSRSISDKGVIQPILVRPAGDGYEIIAGECRYRGSKAAAANTIPAVIRDYTDEQVLELQLIENIHRKDLTPMEQAAGYRKLIDANPDKHSAESIAQRIGMSVAWVWDRLKLNDLVPEAKELLEHERISIGHAILIARQTPENQARIINPEEELLWAREGNGLDFDPEDEDVARSAYDGLKPKSIRELEGEISNHIRFDVAHAAKAVPLEFEDVAEKVEAAAAQPGRGKKVVHITFDHRASDEIQHDGNDFRNEGSVRIGCQTMDELIAAAREVVICAAVKRSDGLIIRGHRHDDCLKNLWNRPDRYGFKPPRGEDQGFVTSRNRYVDRREGLEVQLLAGIPSARGSYQNELYSEDLY